MPSRADDSQYHAGGEDEAEGEDHQEDVCPEDSVEGVGGCDLAFGDFVVATVGEGGLGEEQEESEERIKETRGEAEGGGVGGCHNRGREVIGVLVMWNEGYRRIGFRVIL